MKNLDSDSFPRGGRRVIPIPKEEKNKRKHEDNLFASDKQPKAKRLRKEKKVQKETLSEDLWQSTLKLHGTLTYNKIQEGMIILSCIRNITNLAVQIEFPGLTYGHVTINCISDEFTKSIGEKLRQKTIDEPSLAMKNMFDLGQLVPAKILSIQNTEKGHDIQATINPKDINSERIHSSFKKGSTIWANVQSELDHGYELSVGVKNCRVFLPHKNIDEDRKYEIGQPLYCVVHKSEESVVATTLTVSVKKQHIDKVQLEELQSLHNLLPGTKINFFVEEVLPHGLKGKFLEQYFGYIDETQITSQVKLEKAEEGSILQAYILFIEPVTKVTYLTLRGLENLRSPQHDVGKVIAAQVISVLPKGLYLKLEDDEKGFITNRRLINTLTKKAELDIIDAIKKKYPVGTKHNCRILDYNLMQQLYICTFEQSLLKEKLFTVKDLKLGQRVTVKIDKVVPSGLIVLAGHIKGFVPNLHLFNTQYTDSIKGKYAVGMTADAKILNITDEENVIFTLKQGLVEAERCLTNIEEAVPNSQHVGFVVQTKISGALIAFYGNVRGWISNKELNSGNSGQYNDPRDYLFRGQVVNVWILGFKNDKLQVSLNRNDSRKQKSIKIGEKVKGTITAIYDDRIDVEVGPNKTGATIPLAHLSSNLLLCPVLGKTYKVKEEIGNLICIKNSDIPVVSRREGLVNQKNKFHFYKFRDLKKDMVLRCSVEKETNAGIYVSIPVVDYQEPVLILNEYLTSKEKGFQKDQCILTKILNVNVKNRDITLGARRDQISDKSIDIATYLLGRTLDDISHVIQFGQKHNWKLTEYNIGQTVQCSVQKLSKGGGCLVTLPNGANGVVAPHLCVPNLKLGEAVEGLILDYNFVENYLAVCIKNNVKQKVNKTQDGVLKKSFHSSSSTEILLITKHYAIGVLRNNEFNRQLVYLPLSFHENDENSIVCMYEDSRLKTVIQSKIANKIIGIPKKLFIASERNLKSGKTKNKPSQNSTVNRKVLIPNENDDTETMDVIDSEEENASESQDFRSNEDIVVDDNLDTKKEQNSSSDEDEAKKDNTSEIVKVENIVNIGSDAPVLSGISSFYNLEDQSLRDEESSSDDDTEVANRATKKKKTFAERAEIAKKEEERILQLEKELSDSATTPQTSDQFERALLANPNSSSLWLKYIAMYLTTTEVNKARGAGQRALETIDKTLIEERLNVWIALLNLENLYGTKESFEAVFNDAVQNNDSLEVYLRVINMLANSGKLTDMEEKIKKVRSKEKQNIKMWLEIGKVYYSLEKFREARNIKEAALRSILDHRRQFDLIIRFGIMEFQLGELDQAVANFETILDTYPSKINIWIIYIDQLIKKKKIDEARQVLERATSQKFALKSMKTLFQKFVSFEELYGTRELVENIKQRAKEYVNSVR